VVLDWGGYDLSGVLDLESCRLKSPFFDLSGILPFPDACSPGCRGSYGYADCGCVSGRRVLSALLGGAFLRHGMHAGSSGGERCIAHHPVPDRGQNIKSVVLVLPGRVQYYSTVPARTYRRVLKYIICDKSVEKSRS